MEDHELDLDERLAAQQPLLGLHDGDYNLRNRPKRPWYRRRLATVTGVVLLLFGLSYLVVSSQITRIATKAIKDTVMHIDRMDLSQPQSTSVMLNLSLSLMAASPFPATVEPATFSIKYDGLAVGIFQAPSMTITHGTNYQDFPNATLKIQDKNAWDQFAGDMMRLSKVEYEVSSKLNIHVRLLGGLVKLSASDIPLNKVLKFRGMDGLRNMQIAQVDMQHSTQKQVVATIKTCIRNPSVTTIRPVGALCLNAHYPKLGHDTLVAHLTTSEDTGLPVPDGQPSHPYCASLQGQTDMTTGYNLLELQGEMLGTNSEAISGLISKYLSNASAELTVVTCKPQATSVELYNEAMKNLTIESSLPPQKDPLVGNMFFRGISLHAPEEGKENDIVRLDTAVLVEATSPLGPNSMLTITDVHMNVSLKGADVALGTLSTVSVEIIDGKLVGRSNISVECLTELDFAERGKAFGRFVRASVVKEKIPLTLAGSMDVVCHGALGTLNLSGLPLRVTTLLNGMNNFHGVTVKSFGLPGTGSPTEHEEPIETQIEIRNPSVFTVSIGTLTMDLSLNAPREKFGSLHGRMNLAPGMNNLEMNGQLKPIIDAAGKVSAAVAGFFSRYLEGKSSQVVVKITDTQYPHCVWMQEALTGLTIGTSFPGVESEFQMIKDIKMNQLDVILDEAPPGERGPVTNTRMRVRTDMKAKVKMPASINMPLKISNLSVALTLENEHGEPLGSLVSDRETCEFNQTDDGAFRLNMSNFYPIGFTTHEDVIGMSGFIDGLLTKNGSIMMRLASDIDANEGAFPDVETRMGMLALSNIPVKGEPLIPAMDSFRHPPVKILSVDIQRGSPSSMVMTMEFSLQNPSIVQTKLGSLVLDVFSDGARMGSAKIADFSLNCCGKPTVLRGSFEYNPQPSDLATAERFLSNFVCGYFTHGAAQEIAIKGSAESTSLDLLQPAMKDLSIPSKLPTLGELFPATPTLVTSSLLYIPSLFHLTRIPTSLELRNPFSESITVTGVDLELYPCEDQASGDDGNLVCKKYYDKSLARFAPTVFQPIYIPANTNSCFSCCQGSHCSDHEPLCPRASVGQCMNADVQSFLSPEAIATIIHSLTGGLLMRVNGSIGASIGDYATHLSYQQDGLLVTMAK
ncbi:hypothetical protein JG687_00004431 [Phytophthora cactorum]|uniref:Uncharacterized protein n=1 Tax=Phytophthora cactorum TaxID=29920 RepID=A0A329SQC1_9STRA|nr:hypothetical protein Pcac1_g2724 [Phytophthora cactorum]KAG2843478.1 hypothetical protein PC111_g2328 [Phytophthora cactorum]KAG2845688.1 hypothetical protein PC112_g1746 [Phytophthora cactorum]KAG2868082.1 hypothetical protein PC113_g1409 [Phytophthora cactorum]KAG2928069.1 hypothetical protein PC114_g3284 [Phytophthora cactorum]